MYWIDLYQIIRIGRHIHVGDQSDICFAVAQGTHHAVFDNQFSAPIGENWHTTPSVILWRTDELTD